MLINSTGRLEITDFPGATQPADNGSVMASIAGGTLADIERAAILANLEQHDWNLSKAALTLGITRQALYRKMEKFGIMR